MKQAQVKEVKQLILTKENIIETLKNVIAKGGKKDKINALNQSIITTKKVMLDNQVYYLDKTNTNRKNSHYLNVININGGNLLECNLVNAIYQYCGVNLEKIAGQPAHTVDLNTSKLNAKKLQELEIPSSTSIEIKLSNKYATGSVKTSKSQWNIVVCESDKKANFKGGAYLVATCNLEYQDILETDQKTGKQTIKHKIWRIQRYGTYLSKISELLGY